MGKIMGGGEIYAGGFQRFQKEGRPTPSGVEFPRRGFEEKLVELRAGDAPEFARKYKFGTAVAELLEHHKRQADELTEEVCTKFLQANPDFSSYHPALVRAVAESILEEQKREQQKTVH